MKKLMKFARQMREEWLLFYAGTVAAKRRLVEEDARALGGRVIWEDTQ